MKLDRNKLLQARERLGYGLELVGDKAGTAKNSVLRAEHEEDIRPSTARKIARALGVEVADLIKEPEAPKAQDRLSVLAEEAVPEERREQIAGLHTLTDILHTVRRWSMNFIQRDEPQTPDRLGKELEKLHEALFMEGFELYRFLKTLDDAPARGLPGFVRALDDLLAASSEIKEITAEREPGSADRDAWRERHQRQREALRREAG